MLLHLIKNQIQSNLLDNNGVYDAKIAVVDTKTGKVVPKTNNSGISTIFPDIWTADRIKVEVDAAYKNRITHPEPIKAAKGMWYGETPSSVMVEDYLKPKVTAYPLLNK